MMPEDWFPPVYGKTDRLYLIEIKQTKIQVIFDTVVFCSPPRTCIFDASQGDVTRCVLKSTCF